MTSKTVLIAGAAGNIGRKLQKHFAGLGWNLRLLDAATGADLSLYDKSWTGSFAGVDAVIHLASHSDPWAGWASIYKNNWLTTRNVTRAALEHDVKRLVFASSNWVLAGYRNSRERLTTDLPPKPINHYGFAKVCGENLGRVYAGKGRSFIAFRIGWCQATPGNRPGPHMGSRWQQLKWLSDRDLCQAFERSIVQEGVDFAVLNLMSANPGMRWDIEETGKVIGYRPQDGAAPVIRPRTYIEEYKEFIRYRRAARGL